MEDRLISELDYVGSSGYTLNDLLVLVNYDIPEGTTKNTKITDLKNYVLSSVSADTNTFITGFTYNENTFTLYDNSGNTFSASINVLTGLTINGDLIVTGNTNLNSINVDTISATTYQNLPLDIFVTGGTYYSGTSTLDLQLFDGSSVSVSLAGVDGSSGTSGSSGKNASSSSVFNYSANTLILSGDPGDGKIIWNNVTQTGSTVINIDHINADNQDIDILLGLVQVGQRFIIQDKDNSLHYQVWEITGTPIEVFNNYWSYPVTIVESSGTGSTNFLNNQDITIFITSFKGSSGSSGTSGSSGSSGSSGTSGTSGSSGSSGSSGTSGVNGTSGTSGSSGSSSSSGSSGSSGTSGTSGSSGSSGSSGIYTTGGTFTKSASTINFVYNTGGSFNVTGLTDWYTTGFTYSNNTFSIKDNSGNTFNATINTMTGLTVNGNLNVNGNTTLSGSTSQIGNFTLRNSNSGNTGTILLDTSSVTTGTTQTISFQNKSGQIALLGDLATGEPNSKGYVYMQNNATANLNMVQNTWYKVSGTTSTIPSYLNFFTTGSSSNQLLYTFTPATGGTVTYLKYAVSITFNTASGKELDFQLRKNGVEGSVPPTTSISSTGSNNSITLTGIVTAAFNDSFELYIRTTSTGTPNVTVSDLTISLFT